MSKSNIINFPAAIAGRASQSDCATPGKARLTDNPKYVRTDSAMGANVRNLQRSNALLDSSEIWDAVNASRLAMYYQPQYDLQTEQTVVAEALLRLVDSEGRLIYPDRFVDRVERSDLIVPLGRAVIEQVCADLVSFRSLGPGIQRIAINVSTFQLAADKNLLEFIDQTLTRYKLGFTDLEIELTKRQHLTPNGKAASVLRALAQSGMRLVIDDFGAGDSSIMYLTALPVSAIKLDRSFVSRLPDDQSTQRIVKHLLAIARDLGLDIVAEGVETIEQNRYLAEAGCPSAQGFAYARPMSAEALKVFLTERDALRTTRRLSSVKG